MIMKYTVEVTEILRHKVQVEARNKAEAIAKAMDDYHDEKIVLDAEDYEETKFEVI